ncbi:MAG: hypothetical protein M1828_002352, partial [Chrysothrix sp. TS-e1954]
ARRYERSSTVQPGQDELLSVSPGSLHAEVRMARNRTRPRQRSFKAHGSPREPLRSHETQSREWLGSPWRWDDGQAAIGGRAIAIERHCAYRVRGDRAGCHGGAEARCVLYGWCVGYGKSTDHTFQEWDEECTL